MQKNVYGYIRVSTQKQGLGVSLEEQRYSITEYAKKHNLCICKWFEEKETAARKGRAIFSQMIDGLKSGLASGVVIHKIDRSARNLRDWADLGDLVDLGIDVHFSFESVDMQARGGRLAADIQAVVASDFIRNLRDETKKGINGRYRQGLLPNKAPLGYKNTGKGKPKKIDTKVAPLIKKAFELYANGEMTIKQIKDHLYLFGLKSKNGKRLSVMSLSNMLHNPFYTGVLYVKSTEESYQGIHKPIISRELFKKVKDRLDGNTARLKKTNSFTYSRLIKCKSCGYSLIGERQKGIVYYRCHSKNCYNTLREDKIDVTIGLYFSEINISQKHIGEIQAKLNEVIGVDKNVKKNVSDQLTTPLSNLN